MPSNLLGAYVITARIKRSFLALLVWSRVGKYLVWGEKKQTNKTTQNQTTTKNHQSCHAR